MKIFLNEKFLGLFLLTYIGVGILLNFFLPFHSVPCPPCPDGALCALCFPFVDSPYVLKDIITPDFWISALLWPIHIIEYLDYLNDFRTGRFVRL
jgi:hypothetical protein